MKLVPILVGEFRHYDEDDDHHHTPFRIYYHDNNQPYDDIFNSNNCHYYFCVDETMDLILGGGVDWSQQAIPRHHVLLGQQKHASTFLLAESLVCLARSKNLLALAELAGLALGEFMTGAGAAPLMSSLGIRPISPPRLHDVPVIQVTPVHSLEQWAAATITATSSNKQRHRMRGGRPAAQHHCREEERLQSFMQKMAHHPLWQGMHQQHHDATCNDMWVRFASWFGDYHLHPKQRASFMTTLKTQRQQQAIIQSRQRRLLAAASDKASPAHHPHQKCVKKRRSNHNTALHQQDDQRSSASSSSLSSRNSTPPPLPPPPPPSSLPANHRRLVGLPPGSDHDDTHNTWRSVTELHRPVPCKVSPSIQLPPPWSSTAGTTTTTTTHHRQSTREWASLQDIRGEESNLVLLATQATQRQPLPPLSSPPYHRHHHQKSSSIQLPPPREMLSRHPPPSGMV